MGDIRAKVITTPSNDPPTKATADKASVHSPACARYSTWRKEKV
jgi:hypothetical protein